MLQDQVMANAASAARKDVKVYNLHELLVDRCREGTNEETRKYAHYAVDSFYRVLCKALVVRKGQAGDGKLVFSVSNHALL
jgi:hypothetical protein